MLTIKLIFAFGVLLSFTWARPNESSSLPSVEVPSVVDDESVPLPTDGIVYGMILNFTSLENYMQPMESEPVETEFETETSSSPTGEKLVRKKRFLFGLIGSALGSLRNDNWRECGRTPWGTTIYTNGFATACFGACPEHVYCGYGYDDYGGYGHSYGHQNNYIHFG